jgi:predicted phosphoadenosine phosphosulfate sulfurtransferase
MQRHGVRALAAQEVDKSVYDLAIERIERCFDRFDHVAVSFSGGKDSTVCLNLALEVARRRNRLPLDVVHWDEEAISPDTVNYVQRVSDLSEVSFRWYCYPIKHRNACSKDHTWWHPWAPEERHLWCRPLPEKAITTIELLPEHRVTEVPRAPVPEMNRFLYPTSLGRVVVITGIRADESVRRRRLVSLREHDNWICADTHAPHVMLAKPIYDWRSEDVWTAPKKFGWDYNTEYDVLSKLGIPIPQQRVCPPYGQEPMKSLWIYAEAWPDLWEKMLNRVPGAACAARYSKSPLYAFGDSSEKDPDQTWEEAIREQLMQWPEADRAKIAKRIQGDIVLHNKYTNNAPIPEKSRHGLSWEFLFRVALRGDHKKRMKPNPDFDAYHRGEFGPAGSSALRS